MSDTFWVFGYGSLMWNPGFPHRETVPATLIGAHRSLCVYSWIYRGTEEFPGLVFGLDRGGACRGLAFAVDPADRDEVIAYLRAREQVTAVYVEATRPVRIAGRTESAPALTYFADRRHPQYAGRLPIETQVDIVRRASGRAGPNGDYILSTAAHLAELGIRDRAVESVAAALRLRA
ncbi:MAG TPA: gamma-glutamylcyclotransferase [Methylomirabilota bacterium]|nr:gamma-glutamylcyclotransferase [Methylomirabilota bacterium]